MIASVGSRIVSAGRATCRADTADRAAGGHRSARRPPADDPAPRKAGPGPRAGRRRAALDDLPGEQARLPSPARATAAARAFSAGNGFLSGLIVDRLA